MTERLLRIGEIAAQADVSTRTVDYYTTLGLISPAARTEGNYRLYDAAVIDRIATIRRLEEHGVRLDDIAAALTAAPATGLPDLLTRIDNDLRSLRDLAATTEPDAHGLLTAVAARAHALLTTALEIAGTMPVPPV
ncbi:MAG TPA: MerR family transcriptional regulator [Pilimelia sp.]|nr:MerR family transcriptional regulator [Pilimelia sp.]